jgi:tetratricopeptide (TPR) repeat protein
MPSILLPDHIGAWHGSLLLDLREKKCDDALRCYEKIKALGGDNPTIQNDLAHIYLAQGDSEKAFETYEARWHILSHMEPWDFHLREWQGESLKDKLILIHAEQGFGDTIMVSRFLPSLLDQGAVVTLAVEPAMVELFEAQEWNIRGY